MIGMTALEMFSGVFPYILFRELDGPDFPKKTLAVTLLSSHIQVLIHIQNFQSFVVTHYSL